MKHASMTRKKKCSQIIFTGKDLNFSFLYNKPFVFFLLAYDVLVCNFYYLPSTPFLAFSFILDLHYNTCCRRKIGWKKEIQK